MGCKGNAKLDKELLEIKLHTVELWDSMLCEEWGVEVMEDLNTNYPIEYQRITEWREELEIHD